MAFTICRGHLCLDFFSGECQSDVARSLGVESGQTRFGAHPPKDESFSSFI